MAALEDATCDDDDVIGVDAGKLDVDVVGVDEDDDDDNDNDNNDDGVDDDGVNDGPSAKRRKLGAVTSTTLEDDAMLTALAEHNGEASVDHYPTE